MKWNIRTLAGSVLALCRANRAELSAKIDHHVAGSELKAVGDGFAEAIEELPDDIRKYFTGDGDATSLSGAIKGVSEETASLVAGQMNAIRINQLETSAAIRQQLIHLSNNAKAFKPGRGVYRSSYKNAMRLTRTEINMAYRESDWQRWQKLDFVLGYEIRRSNHEPLCECSLCERLVGRYPKWFKFVGWHPQCMCVATPILEDYSSEARHKDRVNKLRSLLYGEEYKKYVSKNTVRDLPDNFKEWFRENEERLENVESVPYFIRDNIHLINPSKKLARRVYDSYDRTVWDDGYFDEDTGGFYISHKLHNFSEEGGGGDAEKEVAKALAMQRKYIEFLPEKGGRDGKKPDAWFDGTTWDVKFMEEANEETIRQYIRDAKKAESVIMFSKRDRYETIRSGIEREIGRQRANGKPIELLPNIYTIIKNEYKLTLVKKIK